MSRLLSTYPMTSALIGGVLIGVALAAILLWLLDDTP